MKSLDGTKNRHLPVILCILMLSGLLGSAKMSLAAEDTWIYKTQMPTGRGFVSGCVVEGRIYVIGGFPTHYSVTSAVEMYDPTTDTWAKMANMPSARCANATCAYDGRIYVFGGVSPDPYAAAKKNVYVYDTETDSWTQRADMPYAIAFCGVAEVDGLIHLIGGTFSASSAPVSRVMAYDPVTDSWTQKANMPTARSFVSACAVDGKIYAIGGAPQNWQAVAYKRIEEYDPSTDSWVRRADMPTARATAGTCVLNGKIYAVGGFSPAGVHTETEVYDPVTNMWATKSPMQTMRVMPVVGSVGNKVYALGGSYPDSQSQPVILATVEEYDSGLGVPSPDFNGDGIINATDFCLLARYWRQEESCVDVAPEPSGDGVVDHRDLAALSEKWLKEILPDSLIAYWRLDETQGTSAMDSVGGHEGLVVGDAQWQPDESALAFDGIDDYVYLPFVLNPKDGPFSIFMWIKGGGSGQVMISQVDNSGIGRAWLRCDEAGGKLMTELQSSGRGGGALTSDSIMSDGHWHRIGLVWDGSYRRLYVDDEKVAVDTAPSAVDSLGSAMFMGVGSSLGEDSYFSGLIDDVRIYNRAILP